MRDFAEMPEEISLGELVRGQSAMSQQLHELREEFTNQHHRLRNDLAPLLRSVSALEERALSLGREIDDIREDIRDDVKPAIRDIRDDHKWLLRAVIGAYGMVALAVIGALLGRIF